MESDLYHYGIPGMKWGIRRSPEQLGHKKKKKRSSDRKEVDELIKRDVKTLSNKEIQTVLQRLNSEEQFKRLTNPKTKKEGKTWTKSTMERIGTATSVAVSAVAVAYGKKAVDYLTKPIIEGLKEGWMSHSYTNGELYHYDNKGMKWGLRRYQNYDFK